MEEISFMNGPCQVIPAAEGTATNRDEYVKLKIPECGTAMETTKPISVPGLIKYVTQQFPTNYVYMFKNQHGKTVRVTYTEFLHQIRICAKAFLHLGLEKFCGVCILGFNSPEWLISNMAAIFASGLATGIYTTNSAEACYHCANLSRANIIVVEDEKQYEKIEKIRSRLPHLKIVVQYTGEPKDPYVLSWKALMKIGEKQSDFELEKSLKEMAVNQCCTLVFTSGTVGNPKAVMLSHDNLTFNARMIKERIDVIPGRETIVSYLPFSHIAAQIVDIYLVLVSGGTIFFADRDALKGSLVKTLREVRPTKFIAVPRVWEKIQEKMLDMAAESGSFRKAIANWAKQHALEYNLKKMNKEPAGSWGYTIASSLILKRIKIALGLDRCNLFASAAAPLSSEIKRYFLSLDIPIMEAFGMSECGCHTLCVPTSFNLDTIGLPLPGLKNKILDTEDDGQGEICAYGRHVFMGYLNDPEKTKETIDEDGWLHTGDIGKQDVKGYVYITGRLKELIITAGGENVPPVPIEQMVQAELPNLGYAVLIGDKKKFLSLLITLKSEVDSESTEPLPTLIPSVQTWLAQLGCPAKTINEVLSAGPDPRLLYAIQSGIDKVNENATSNAQKIQKFKILPSDFSVATGELGPTMKIKRRIVMEKYRDLVDSMYL